MKLFRIILFGLAFASSVTAGSAILGPNEVQAANCPANRAWCNEHEQTARTNCRTNTGVMWFNTSSAAPTTDGYYSSEVRVSADAQFVTVNLRGSVWPCGLNTRGAAHAYYIQAGCRNANPWQNGCTGSSGSTVDGPVNRVGNDYRLSGISSSTLYRGEQQGNGSLWSTQGGTVSGTLDVRGLATNNQNSEARQTIYINIYRCFAAARTGCYSTAQRVDVVRAQQPIRWTITPTAVITSGASINKPGQTLSWNHIIRNNGPNTTNRTITFSGQNQGSIGSGVLWNQNESNIGVNLTRSRPSSRAITQNDVGTNVCRRTNVSPRAWDNGGSVSSGNACRAIPYDYSLLPSITNITDNTITEPGRESIPIQGSVENRGPTKSHTNIRWQTTQVVFGPDTNPTNRSGGVSGNDPCGYFNLNESCDSISAGTRSSAFPGNGVDLGSTYTPTGNTTGSIGDIEVGSRVCFALSVQRNSSASTQWRHSALRCMIVGKQPKVQVQGGALSVGQVGDAAIAQTSITTKRTDGSPVRTFGSWTEYGVFASGRVEGLASASGLNGGVTNAAQSGWSALTYANTDPSTPCTATQFGCYRLARSELPDITSYFQSTTATTLTQTSRSLQQLATAAVGSPAGDSRGGILKKRATTPNTLTLSNGNPSTGAGEYQLPQGRWIVLNMPDTTVNITGNLKYTTDSLSNIASIPQLIIIAKDINIAASVTQVDAWLIASGGISTCTSGGTAQSGGATALTARICDEALTINGPVLTDKLYLRRTAGSGTGDASGDPAEVINLRPDAHMWVRHYIESGAVLRASGTRELPPRF